jgi:hypothetical protein
MYGIEIEEWPVRIAEVAMWLVDHQMNQRVSEQFGDYFVRLPLSKSPHIRYGNALRMDWNDLLPADTCTFVFGNPPFVGKQFRGADQVEDMKLVWGDGGGQVVDYVGCWYLKALDYIRGTSIGVAFVSTNSITQGEQVAALWAEMRRRGQPIVYFAHHTFPWKSEAKGKAHVHVVIVGFGVVPRNDKRIFLYDRARDEPTAVSASRINWYLVDGPDVTVAPRSKPLCNAPPIVFGSMPNDGGHLLLSPEEKRELLRACPEARKYVKRFVGSEEYINGIERWCLWLVDAPPQTIRRMKPVDERVQRVRKHRQESKRATTNRLADVPSLFGEIRQPKSRYLLIPRVSSEARKYLPIGFNRPSIIASDATLVVPSASLFHFGVLTSVMHMSWVRNVAGRLKSDFRYSAKLVYNNFPWPTCATDKQIGNVEQSAKAVLDAREAFPDSTLADLYDPQSMPLALVKAHRALDRAVDRCYRTRAFPDELKRIEYLLELYQKLTQPVLPNDPPRRRGK